MELVSGLVELLVIAEVEDKRSDSERPKKVCPFGYIAGAGPADAYKVPRVEPFTTTLTVGLNARCDAAAIVVGLVALSAF